MKKGQKRSYDEFLLDTPQITSTSLSRISSPNLLNEPSTFEQPARSVHSADLCSRCARIDFKKIFSLSSSELSHCGIAVTDTRKDTDPGCSLCLLILSFGYEEADILHNGYHLRALHCLKVLKLRRGAHRRKSTSSIVVVAVPGTADISLCWRAIAPLNTAITRGLIAPISSASTTHPPNGLAISYSGRKVDPKHVNFDLLRSWIQDCHLEKNGHRECRRKSNQATLEMNVIDCFTQDIVPMEKHMEYMALSYVWGEQKPATRATESTVHLSPNCVPIPAPATVEDAIEVVKGLNMRYLWVDRYCIPNTPNKHTLIQNMGLVYEGAVATIVAIFGTHSDTGLPGVSLIRKKQSCVETNAGTLVSTLQHVSRHISESKWICRGWTFQEAFLSKRCLFFTEEQVYFACKGSTRAESVLQYPLTISGPSRDKLTPGLMTVKHQIDFRLSSSSRPTMREYVQEYTNRSLSYPEDGLKAFKGMLARLEYRSYWGVPFVYDPKPGALLRMKPENWYRAFVYGLHWLCVGLSRGERMIGRRSGLPTWCWASLVGEICCCAWGYSTPAVNVTIEVEDFNGSTQDMCRLLERNAKKGQVIEELTRYIHITAYVTKVTIIPRVALKDSPSFEADLMFVPAKACRFTVHVDMFTDLSLMARFEEKRKWDVLALQEDPFSQRWLILEYKGTTAYRVGMLIEKYWPRRVLKIADIPGEVKTVRLG